MLRPHSACSTPDGARRDARTGGDHRRDDGDGGDQDDCGAEHQRIRSANRADLTRDDLTGELRDYDSGRSDDDWYRHQHGR
jgi:hypothetical protein